MSQGPVVFELGLLEPVLLELVVPPDPEVLELSVPPALVVPLAPVCPPSPHWRR